MRVSLRKPYALEVATITSAWSDTTHAIRGHWSYFRTNYTVCGRPAQSKLSRLNHMSNDHTVAITCRACNKGK
ncbi:hypothetical protein ACFWOT_09055 [Streptomyces sp. NPDC058440]|uniref:hypothetical protein n=1 Tax=Streptomyces sp. NPDC058440 TaxID=3346501 RepID=UPI0036575774